MTDEKYMESTIISNLLNGNLYWNHLTGECVLYDDYYDNPNFRDDLDYETFCITTIDLARSKAMEFEWLNDDDDIERGRAAHRIATEDGWHLSRPCTDTFYLAKAKEAM